MPKLSVPAQITEWARLKDNRNKEGQHPSAPAYVTQWGNLLAGLMQARPPEVNWTGNEPQVTVDEVSDIIDELTPVAAGLGVGWLRPVALRTLDEDGNLTDEVEWVTSIEGPQNVLPVWEHQRLQTAIVWTVLLNKAGIPSLALAETWDNNTGQVTLRVYEVDDKGETKGDPITSVSQAQDLVVEGSKQTAETWVTISQAEDTVKRFLVPFVWRWDNKRTVPVYAGNEGMVRGLISLSDQEQDDGEMARHRLIIDEDLLSFEPGSENTSTGSGEKFVKTGQQRTFSLKNNLMRVKRGQMKAQNLDNKDLIQPVTFPDSFIQSQRIERRENSVLEAIGINPQSVGRNVGGRSDSASAKRADQQMTTQTVTGPARRLSTALNASYEQLAVLNGWSGFDSVVVHEGLKASPADTAATVKLLADSGVASTRTLVALAHPNWGPTQVTAEVEALVAEGLAPQPIE